MVTGLWILKMGNQVSSNLKHALYLENSTKSSNSKRGSQDGQTIGILSFEVANLMSKIIHLHKSLTDNEILRLKNEIIKSEGVRTLVSSDERLLLELGLAEKLDDLNGVASVVSRLGKKCTIPALQGFEHVYGDIVSGLIDIKELGFLVKDMESMVRKMERYVNSTARLYAEIEVMNELEVATKKFQQNRHEESRKAFEQKLTWQKQDVRHLKNVSLWNQTYDKVVELLARTVSTIYARLYVLFGDAYSSKIFSSASVSTAEVGNSGSSLLVKQNPGLKYGQPDAVGKVNNDAGLTKSVASKNNGSCHSGPIFKGASEKRIQSLRPKVGFLKNERGLSHAEDFNFACGMGPGRLFMECLSLSSFASEVDNNDQSSQISGLFGDSRGVNREFPDLSGCFIHAINTDPFSGNLRHYKEILVSGSKFGPKNRLLMDAPSTTVGGSALAVHYANVIIVLEKLLCYPHLVGDDARDDLYQMLPTSLRKTLKTSLKSYVKDLAIYDAPLAHDWRGRLDSMLKWLAPLAHNMIRWQSERNFEQQQIVKRTNVLLLQTLYFADREKTEAAICELLVGLNYICRYEQQQNALLDCTSSFDLEDCMEWQMQVGASLHD